jgi:hypothetical protein
LAYTLFQEKRFNQKVELFVQKEFSDNGYALIYKDINYNANLSQMQFAFLVKKFSPQELEILNNKLSQYDIDNTILKIRQDTIDIKGEILDELGNQNKTLLDKEILINNLESYLTEYKVDYTQTIKELAILFPGLKNVSLGSHIDNTETDSSKVTTVLLYQTVNKNQEIDTIKIRQWLNHKLNTTEIKIVNQQ